VGVLGADTCPALAPDRGMGAPGRVPSIRQPHGQVDLSTLKRPSALIPLAMSFAALSLVLGHILVFGVVRESDEGTAAHLWQLLMAGQLPIIAVFAVRWLPRTPGPALLVLVLQAVAALAAAAPVFLLGL
jgi:hypothetical protein